MLLLIGLVFACGCLIYWLYESGGLPSFDSPYEVRVVVPSAEGIVTGSGVRIAGVVVGRLTGIERRGIAAVLTLQIDQAHSPLPVDTRAGIGLLTLVGENYVQLEPGRSRQTIPTGGVLPIDQANGYVNVDQILDTLRGPARTRARELIQSLGGALDGRGDQLNGVVGGTAALITKSTPVLSTADHDRSQLAGLINNLGIISDAISARGADLQQFANRARVTFAAIADRDQALRQTLDQLPGILSQVRSTSNVLTTVTRRATPVLYNLAAAVNELKPAVENLAPGAQDGRRVLDALSSAAPPLTGTLNELRRAAPPTVATLPKLHNVLCQINPILRYALPYLPDVEALLHDLGSVTNYYDASGHASRLLVALGQDSLGFLNSTEAAAIQLLLQNGIVGKAYSTGYDPLPAPGQNNGPIGTRVGGPAQWAQSHPYPHITADC
jgi:phospholipid/cholesterol/gamma-HCH transport system substrate-binding protein